MGVWGAVEESREIRVEPIGRQRRLTQRQCDVLILARDGVHINNMSETLGISKHTIHNHFREIAFRLNTSGRTQAVVRAIALGEIPLG